MYVSGLLQASTSWYAVMHDIPLIGAGCIAFLAAAIHGIAGEILVVSQLSPGALPSTRLGDSKMTKTMVRAGWHLATIAFLTVGFALVLSGSVLHGDAARGIALVAASASTGFAALVVGLAIVESPRGLLHHPGPAVLTAAAVLAWWGVL